MAAHSITDYPPPISGVGYLASGLLGSSHKTAGSDLLARIRRLLGLSEPSRSLPGRSLAAVLVVLLAIALPVGLHLSARASDPLPAATQPAAGRIPALIGQLGSPSAKEREEAQKALVEIGPEAVERKISAESREATVGEEGGDRLPAPRRILELIYVLRYSPMVVRNGEWGRAVRELITIGKPAVPALAAELDRTRSDFQFRSLAFVLRGIGDVRAVPALIRALPRTAVGTSDYGGVPLVDPFVPDPTLDPFLARHSMEGRTGFGFGRAVREVTGALEKLTGHTEGDAHLSESVRRRRQEAADRWQKWWDKDGKALAAKEDMAAMFAWPAGGIDPVEAAGQTRFGPLFPVGPGVALGDVVEMALPAESAADSDRYVDLDTGRRFVHYQGFKPTGEMTEQWAWLAMNGIDMTAMHYHTGDMKSRFVLQGFQARVWQVENSRWDSFGRELVGGKPIALGEPKADFCPRGARTTGSTPSPSCLRRPPAGGASCRSLGPPTTHRRSRSAIGW